MKPGIIAWPAILLVVKQIPLVKLICTLDLGNDEFSVTQVILWSNAENKYAPPITNEGNPISPGALQHVLEQYRDIEGIR
jgi:hypothetical protein